MDWIGCHVSHRRGELVRKETYQPGKQVTARGVEGWLFNIHQQACESTATEMDQ